MCTLADRPALRAGLSVWSAYARWSDTCRLVMSLLLRPQLVMHWLVMHALAKDSPPPPPSLHGPALLLVTTVFPPGGFAIPCRYALHHPYICPCFWRKHFYTPFSYSTSLLTTFLVLPPGARAGFSVCLAYASWSDTGW